LTRLASKARAEAFDCDRRWTAFVRKLARRGLRGVKLVISDAHEGIKATSAVSGRCYLLLAFSPVFPFLRHCVFFPVWSR